MRALRFVVSPVLLAGLLVSTGSGLDAQVREVVSSRIAVSDRDATLALELGTGGSLEIAFRDGEVRVDGEPLGSYEPGGPLHASWRSLLGDVVALDGDPLARALVEWSAPEGLEAEAAALGGRLEDTLEARLSASRAAPEQPEAAAARGSGQEVSALLRRTDRLEALAEALEGLSLEAVRIRVGEDVSVASGEVVEATLVVVDGDLEVRGTVDGDAVVTGGTLTLFDGGRIAGEVRLADAELSRRGGEIGGTVLDVRVDRQRALEALEELPNLDLDGLENLEEELEDLEELRADLRSRIRDEVRRELRDELRAERPNRSRGPDLFSPLRWVGRGLGGLVQNLIVFVLLTTLGIVLAHFFPERIERIADGARHAPGRAAMVGAAGAFLLVPAWIVGIVALAVSIVGIPVMIAWIPLFPLAACLAAGVGYLAAARLLGEWIAARGFRGLEDLRPSNAIHALVAGVLALLIPFAAANVVEMTGPWLGAVEGLLVAVGWMAAAAAISVGFGAVLLTRGGGRPHGAPPGGTGGDPDWTEGPGPTPPPADEAEWTDRWEDLERRARGRADEPSAKEAGPEEEPPRPGSGGPDPDDEDREQDGEEPPGTGTPDA